MDLSDGSTADAPAADAPAADAPAADAPAADAPAADAPTHADAPAADAPATDAPTHADAPAADAPTHADAPAADAPTHADAPTTDAPTHSDAPAADAPTHADAPTADAPPADAPNADAPTHADAPAADAPPADAPTHADAPGADAPNADAPTHADAPAAHAPAQPDAPESDAPAGDAPTADGPAAEAPVAAGTASPSTGHPADATSTAPSDADIAASADAVVSDAEADASSPADETGSAAASDADANDGIDTDGLDVEDAAAAGGAAVAAGAAALAFKPSFLPSHTPGGSAPAAPAPNGSTPAAAGPSGTAAADAPTNGSTSTGQGDGTTNQGAGDGQTPPAKDLAANNTTTRSVEEIDAALQSINPNFDPSDPANGYATNCGNTSSNLNDFLNGSSSVEASTGTLDVAQMEARTGNPQTPMTPDQIASTLTAMGPGSHCVVGIDRSTGDGHWFNAYFDGDTVWALDAQTGTRTPWPPVEPDATNWDASIQPELVTNPDGTTPNATPATPDAAASTPDAPAPASAAPTTVVDPSTGSAADSSPSTTGTDSDAAADEPQRGWKSKATVGPDHPSDGSAGPGTTYNGYDIPQLTPEIRAQLDALAADPRSPIVKNTDGTYALKTPIDVDAFTRTNPDHDWAEFQRQVGLQQQGLNQLTVAEWRHNVEFFRRENRVAQSQQGRAIKALKKLGVPFTNPAVLHGPDQSAGGRANRFDGAGDSPVNSSLGGAWSGRRITELFTDVQGAVRAIDPKLLAHIHMTVHLGASDALSTPNATATQATLTGARPITGPATGATTPGATTPGAPSATAAVAAPATPAPAAGPGSPAPTSSVPSPTASPATTDASGSNPTTAPSTRAGASSPEAAPQTHSGGLGGEARATQGDPDGTSSRAVEPETDVAVRPETSGHEDPAASGGAPAGEGIDHGAGADSEASPDETPVEPDATDSESLVASNALLDDTYDLRPVGDSLDDSTKAVNKYGYGYDAVRYGNNCHHVVNAHELHLRGYDVIAAPTVYGVDVDPVTGQSKALPEARYPGVIARDWMQIDGTTRDFEVIAPTGGSTATEALTNLTTSWPVGARGYISGQWKKGNAHIFSVVKEAGGLRFVDGQTGDTDVSWYLDMLVYDYAADGKGPAWGIHVLRVDDLVPTESLLGSAMRADGDAQSISQAAVEPEHQLQQIADWRTRNDRLIAEFGDVLSDVSTSPEAAVSADQMRRALIEQNMRLKRGGDVLSEWLANAEAAGTGTESSNADPGPSNRVRRAATATAIGGAGAGLLMGGAAVVDAMTGDEDDK
ncbi:toxin glutamine deamidase domain-containing protein [Agromyces salentinus]|uniref:toxin glutamine deamidase domain-containing protein n=1 Tax=Agromyces salentinus TaxID=269421 RepID=UPI0012FAFDF8|nr:toxin glutamine deamidase domain-containing protein [Agromyces salentinus]